MAFEGTIANGLGGLHHAPKSNHRHFCHIEEEENVHFGAGEASKEREREREGRVNKPRVPQPPQNSSFTEKKKKTPRPNVELI